MRDPRGLDLSAPPFSPARLALAASKRDAAAEANGVMVNLLWAFQAVATVGLKCPRLGPGPWARMDALIAARGEGSP
jgi:hypothetical protein